MPFEKSYDLPEPITEPACIHLRSKAMYVTGEVDAAPTDEAGSHYCWCNLTQHILGPDQADVDRRHCTPGRDCYRSSY